VGHTRLRTLPRTQRWQEVVRLLESDGALQDVAQASYDAAQAGLSQVPRDPGFAAALAEIFAFAGAIQAKEPVNALWEKGFSVPSEATFAELVGSLRQRIDERLQHVRAGSDIGELALNSFSEALLRQAASELPSMFKVSPETSREVLRNQLSGSRFKGLMHEFYSVFTCRYLSYYLSRELPKHVGAAGARFANIQHHQDFDRAFDLYVRQTVRIADEFTPGWFGKAQYEGTLSHESVTRYARVAFKKIRSEFARGYERA